MKTQRWKTILAWSLALSTLGEPVIAGGRGGGGRAGGGARPGGGGARPAGGNFGGARPGGNVGGPHPGGMNRTPSFNAQRPTNFTPRPSSPAVGARPNNPGGQNLNRPGMNNVANRPVNSQVNANQLNRTQNNANQLKRNPNLQAGNRVGNTNVNSGNRTQLNNTTNRVKAGNTINSGNRVTQNNLNRTVNNTYNITNVNSNNRVGGYGGYRNNYYGYHSNWVHGSWNNHYGGWANNAAFFGAGLGVGALAGWGLASWAYSPSVYNWGYASYSNPYYVVQQPVVIQQQPVVIQQPGVVVQQPPAQAAAAPVYNYQQPINSDAPPPEESTSDAALAIFDQARNAFFSGDYTTALGLTDQALAKMPGDPAMHEFRAACLFALGQYDQAASVLYGVLSAGPGWDWTTMASLYPEVGVYTGQLRKLEEYCRANPNSASARFVLGYQYLVEGFPENADREFSAVAKLKPNDKLSAQLAAQLVKPDDARAAPPVTPPADPQPEPAASPVPAGATIAGSWSASPAQGVSIGLSLGADGAFKWTVKAPGQATIDLTGTSSYENGVLTLTQKSGEPLVGRVTWKDATHMNFKAVGAPPEDPGLAFAK